jgi:hypothetical protein
MMYGSSTGRAPIHVNMVTSATIVQNNIYLLGRIDYLQIFFYLKRAGLIRLQLILLGQLLLLVC